MAQNIEDVVIDSEEEDVLPRLAESSIHTTSDPTAAKLSAPSSILGFTPHELGNTESAIASPASEPYHHSKNAQAPVSVVKPRPKPRPRFKKAQAEKTPSPASGVPQPSIDDVPPPQHGSHFDDISTTEPPLTIADRAKSRVRKSKNPSAATSFHATNDIINIPTSSEDELQFIPSSRSKSKSKSKKLDRKLPEHTIEIPESQTTLPLPTSDIQLLPPSTSSQLPPSDPPNTTSSTPEFVRIQRANENNLSPPSSPWQPVRKRKRHSLIENDAGINFRRIPSPEPFFAPSFAMPAPDESIANVNDDNIGSNAPRKKSRKASKLAPKSRKKDAKDDEQSIMALNEGSDIIMQPSTSPQSAPKIPAALSVVVSGKRPAKDRHAGEEQGVKTTKKTSRRKEEVEDQEEVAGHAEEDSEVNKPKAKKRATDKNAKSKRKGRRVASDEGHAKGAANLDVRTDGIPTGIEKADVLDKEQPSPPDRDDTVKENTRPLADEPEMTKPKSKALPSPSTVQPPSSSNFARLNYSHSIANNAKPTSMADLIRKVNSLPGAPHNSSSIRRTYSPMLKSSRSAIRKIAPLHQNRRTPPPLPPKPPAPKKTKKQLELEEKWEEELEESIEGWACLTTEERDLLRKAKRDKEMGWED